MELEFDTLDLSEDTPRLRGWLDTVQHAFLDRRAADSFRDSWRRAALADDETVRGAWLPDGVFGAEAQPVATLAGYDKSVSTGRELLPARLVTDVTVDPAHRRQGLLRTLLTDDLADAAGRGLPLAVLTVSEGGIYGRFGFGCASRRARVEVDTHRFALRPGARPDGRVVVVDPREHREVFAALFASFHRGTPGSVDRHGFYPDAITTGVMDHEQQEENRRLRAAVSLDADEEPDGYVVWAHSGSEEPLTAHVRDLVATTPAAYLSLWDLLGNLDLCDRVVWDCAPADEPLRWALTEPHCLRTTALRDHVWVRVLDVSRVLGARRWSCDGEVVLGVTDPLGYATGSYRVRVEGGTAEVTRIGAEPEISLDVETLGAFALGDPVAMTLRAAGRLHGSDDALARWAAMSDGQPVPHSVTFF